MSQYPNGGTPPTTVTTQPEAPAHAGWLPRTGSEFPMTGTEIALALILVGSTLWIAARRFLAR